MPKPVSMFKADDGTLFDKLADAIAHEQKVFLKSSLTPLFKRLYDASADAEGDSHADRMVAVISQDRELAAEFQKAFAKLQVTPNAPASRKRPSAKKNPPKDPAAPTAGDAPPPAPASVDVPPYVPPSGEPSEEHMAGLDSLGGAPISLPADSEEAPPPPQPQ